MMSSADSESKPLLATATTTPAQKITKGDVVNKFKELHKKYYVTRGYMIHTVSDVFSKQFCEMHAKTGLEWNVEYNQYADTRVRVIEIKTFV